MKKYSLIKIVSLILALFLSFSIVGCSAGSGKVDEDGNVTEIVDDEKTINIRSGKNGYGTTYTTALKKQFEKTFEAEGYKVNVLPAIEDLSAKTVYRDIYSGSKIDVYFTEGVKAIEGIESSLDGFGHSLYNITENVYKKPAIKFDGTEETKTIEEKLYGMDMQDAMYQGGAYYIPYALSPSGLAVNKRVLDIMGLSLPRTTKELFDTADKIMKTADDTDRYPFTFSLTGNSYIHATINTWIAQYNGVEEYNSIYSYQHADGTNMTRDEICNLYKLPSFQYALESVYHFYDWNMAAPGSATSTFSTVQGKVMQGNAVFYGVGSWMYNEECVRFKNRKNDIVFINVPMISELGVKLFGSGTVYNYSDEECDKVLSTIIKYADQNKLAEDIKPLVDSELGKNILIEDITTVCERRGITRIRMNSNIIINNNSTKKEIAELFLRFCASEEAGTLFAAETNSPSPYSYQNPVNSDVPWINSVHNLLMNPYIEPIQSEPRGLHAKLTDSLLPKLGYYFAVPIYEKRVSKYNEDYKIVKTDSVYTDAAKTTLTEEYEYIAKKIDKNEWKIS